MVFHLIKHQSYDIGFLGRLTIDGAELCTGTERVDDVDDQAVSGGPQRQGPSTHQQGHNVEQERQMTSNCKRHTITTCNICACNFTCKLWISR